MKISKLHLFTVCSFIIILAFLLFHPTETSGQAEFQDSLAISGKSQTPQEEKLFSGGLQFEALAITGFAQLNTSPKFRIGAGYNLGFNFTNLIPVAGENFSRKRTINYDNTEGEKRPLLERRGFYLFANFRFNKLFDLSLGYKSADFLVDHYYNFDGDGDLIKGKFKGIYIQPSFGKGKVQYAARLMFGKLIINEINESKPRLEESGVLFQPLIVTIYISK